MAELIQRELEKMVDGLEELRLAEILSSSEVKSIIKSRREHEYEIRSNAKHLTDFIRYIEYELNLQYLINKRKKKQKNTKTLYSNNRKIISLFETALTKWRGDKSLWFLYQDFLVRSGNEKVLGRVMASAIRYMPNYVPFWIMAASWEFFHNDNISSARILLQRANRLNPRDQRLFVEYARLELAYLKHLELKLQACNYQEHDTIEVGDQEELLEEAGVLESTFKKLGDKNLLIEGGIPLAIFYSAIKVFPDSLELRIKFARLFSAFSNTEGLLEAVANSIQESFSTCPLAQFHLATWPYHYRPAADSQLVKSERQSFIVIAECISNIDECLVRFKDSVSSSIKIYECYIKFLIQCKSLRQLEDGLVDFVDSKLEQVFQDAISNNCMSPHLAISVLSLWLDIGNCSLFISNCKKLHFIFPENPRISLAFFKLLEVQSVSEGGWVLDDGRLLVQEKQVALEDSIKIVDTTDSQAYQLLLYYAAWEIENRRNFLSEAEFTRIVINNLPADQCILFKCKLLDELKKSQHVDSDTLRTFLHGPYLYPPNNVSVYFGVIQMEIDSFDRSTERVRSLFQRAISQFGHESIELWIRAIEWEKHNGNFQVASLLHQRACRELKQPETFVDRIVLSQHSVGDSNCQVY